MRHHISIHAGRRVNGATLGGDGYGTEICCAREGDRGGRPAGGGSEDPGRALDDQLASTVLQPGNQSGDVRMG